MTLIEPDGIWCDVRTPGFPAHRPALFLDRDGTLIELVDYLASPDKVCLIDAAVEAIRTANNAGVAVVVVTNQSGIGRGYYDWTAFEAVQTRLYELLMAADARIDAAYACPHPPPSAGLAAGKAAGLSAGLLVETGYGDRDLVAARALEDDRYDVAWADWS